MNLFTKLQNPVALALQGFIAGGILFFTLQPLAADREPASTSGGSVLETLQI